MDAKGAGAHDNRVRATQVIAGLFSLQGALASAACQSAPPPEPKPQETKPRVKRETQPGDAVIDGCLAEYPKEGYLGGGIDSQKAWKVCMIQSGQEQGLCDPANMISLACAVCIARGKGLPMAAQWRARLEFAPAPIPRVLWRLALPDESAHTLVDAHRGETIVLQKSPPLGSSEVLSDP